MADEFDTFWAAYPRKVGKGTARTAFLRARKKVLLQGMLDALRWQVTQPQWAKDGGRYVPYPATWLNGERWHDEPVKVAPAGSGEAWRAKLDHPREYR